MKRRFALSRRRFILLKGRFGRTKRRVVFIDTATYSMYFQSKKLSLEEIDVQSLHFFSRQLLKSIFFLQIG